MATRNAASTAGSTAGRRTLRPIWARVAPMETATVMSVGSTSRVPAATRTTMGKRAKTAALSTAVVSPMPKTSAIHGRIRTFGTPYSATTYGMATSWSSRREPSASPAGTPTAAARA